MSSISFECIRTSRPTRTSFPVRRLTMVSPLLSAPLFAVPGLAGLPFVLAGGLKIGYDLLVYRGFRARQPPEER